MPELNCSLMPVKSAPGTGVVVLRGAIDPKNVETLQNALMVASGRGFQTLVLDLGEIRYINSAGLAYLVNLSDFLEQRGGSLHMANAQPKVKLIFELMGLTELFTLYKTVDAALAAAGKNRRAPAISSPQPASPRVSRRTR